MPKNPTLKPVPRIHETRTRKTHGGHRWQARARNGRIIGAATESYKRKSAAQTNRAHLLSALLGELAMRGGPWLIDADPDMANAAAALLKRMGYEVPDKPPF